MLFVNTHWEYWRDVLLTINIYNIVLNGMDINCKKELSSEHWRCGKALHLMKDC